MRLLPFSFPALHLLFGDGERLAHGIVEAFGFGVSGDRWGGANVHAVIIARLSSKIRPVKNEKPGARPGHFDSAAGYPYHNALSRLKQGCDGEYRPALFLAT